MTTTADPNPVAEEFDAAGDLSGGLEAAIRAAGRPVEFAPFDDERAERHLALPPDWQHITIEPEPFRTAPDLQLGTYATYTAEGFVLQVDALRETSRDPRLVATPRDLTAIIDPGTLAAPSFEELKVKLAPSVSDELTEWIGASKPHQLDAWARFVEDHQADIDAAVEHEATARTFLDVIGDARTWNVEARRAVRRIRNELGEADDVDEYKAEVVGSALASFQIRVPVLRFGEPFTLTVALTRDLDAMTIAPRIPGIQRVIDLAVSREIDRAEATLGIDVIR